VKAYVLRRTKQKKTFDIIRKELDIRLGEEISAYKNIEWTISSKRYKDVTEPKYELCLLVIQTMRNQARKHKSDDKYVSFSSIQLRKKLGVDYIKVMDTCFIKKKAGGGYEMKKDRVTYKYKLKDIVLDICKDVYADSKLVSKHIGRGGLDITRNTIPNYSVTGSKQGKEIYEYKWPKQMKSLVTLNDTNIRILLSVYADLYKKYIQGEKVNVLDGEKLLKEYGWDIKIERNKNQQRFHNILEERFEKIKAIVDMTHDTQIGIGNIVQLYKQVDSGRFYLHGDTNLQTIPKEMRKIVMGGMGYYDYDIENCHYVLLEQLNNMYGGEPLTHVKRYINNTDTFRKQISKELGLSLGLSKKLLLMIVYGGGLTVRHRYNKETGKNTDSAIINDLKVFYNDDDRLVEEAFDNIQNNKTIMGIYNDVKTARDLLLSDKDYYIPYHGKEHFKNHINRRTLLRNGREKKSKGSLLSHILQGIESYILLIAKAEDDGIVMWQHDGWVSKNNIDVDIMSDVINRKLQYHFEKMGYNGTMKISVTKEELSDINRTPALNSRIKRKVVLS